MKLEAPSPYTQMRSIMDPVRNALDQFAAIKGSDPRQAAKHWAEYVDGMRLLVSLALDIRLSSKQREVIWKYVEFWRHEGENRC